MGCKGAVGSTYNLVPSIYHQIFENAEKGNLETAAKQQSKSIQFVDIMAETDFWGATKALFKKMNLDMGPVKIPHYNLTESEVSKVFVKLKKLEIDELKACDI